MSFFPFMQKIDQKRFLVVGAGAVARRKVRLLLQFTDRITLITHPATNAHSADLQELADFADKGVEILNRSFSRQDLEKADFCIASSDSFEDNHKIAYLCREAGLPVNVPDDPDSCTFFMPSVVKRGKLLITVSTEGSSPAMSAALRGRIEGILPPDTEKILDRMEELRRWVPSRLPRSQERGRLYSHILGQLMEGSILPTENSVRNAAVQWIENNIDQND